VEVNMLYTPKEEFSVMKDVVAPYMGVLIAVAVFLSVVRCIGW
jgi:hypothetical protein